MMYAFWDMEHYRHNFCHFGLFLPFHPLNNPEKKNFEKMKKKDGDVILQMCTMNDNHMMYDSWDMEHTQRK